VASLFFSRNAAADEEAVQPGHRHVQTNADQRLAQLFKRDVLAFFPDSKDVRLPSHLELK
jgi:hypothetical protein